MRQVTKIEMETLEDVEVHGVYSTKEQDYEEIKPETPITAEILNANLQRLSCDLCEDLRNIAEKLYEINDRVEALERKG